MEYLRIESDGFMNKVIAFFLLLSATAGAQQHLPGGLIFDPVAYGKVPMKAVIGKDLTLPRKVSYEAYCPPVMNQENYGTCVAFATTYYLRSILQGISGKPVIFSPSYTYEKIREPADIACGKGVRIADALYVLKKTGALPYDSLPYPHCGTPDPALDAHAASYRIAEVLRLFGEKSPPAYRIAVLKKALGEGYPLVVGMETPFSFFITREVWELAPGEVPSSGRCQALCLVGYDDDRFGGAFRVVNSWGAGWADRGFCWIRYRDLARFVREAYQVFPEVSPSVKGTVRVVLSDGRRMETLPSDAAANGFYRARDTYASGTAFKLFVSNSQQSYVYALATDTTGQVNRLFPRQDDISPLLGRNTTVVYPSESHSIVLDKTPGTDYLIVLFSKKELKIDEIAARLQAAPGSVSDKVREISGRVSARYETDSPAVETDGRQNVVPLIVAIPHQ